jgi:isoquinoline 1-oxidoreductase alpha subunit
MPTQTFTLNGECVTVDVDDDVHLLWVIRDLLGVTGPKYGCGINVCKACTSHINGKAFNPCSVRVGDIKESDKITTIEGLADTVDDDDLHPMQRAWIDHDVAQCGYCQPGQIMSATALLKGKAKPTDADIDAAMSGNICRCATYTRIRAAIKLASGQKTEA